MKFRGLLDDVTAMKDFMGVTNSVSKLAKECILRLTTDKVYFIISDEDAKPRRPLMWCELPINFYFREYNLVGFSEQHNEIYLLFVTALLARSIAALKQNAKVLKIKLTHKVTPCLTLEIELISSEVTQNRQLIHDIPVEVIEPSLWNDYREPHYDNFHVSIQLPPLKPIKNIVERMKNMGHLLIVSADKLGRLKLEIKTNLVKLCAHFPDLNVESFDVGHMETLTDENDAISCTIDIKKFLMFLTGMQLNNYKTTCSIVQNQMVKLALDQPGVLFLQCFFTEVSL